VPQPTRPSFLDLAGGSTRSVSDAAAMTKWENPAAWYDVLNPWGPSDDFYLGMVMAADRVLDVGCGTGRLLHRARDLGHAGRLCGLDPDPAMLHQARVRTERSRGDRPEL